MESLHKLKKMMCRELDEISNKGDMSAGDLEAVHKLTDTIKNIDKIMYLEGDSEYSRGGDWDTSGRYSRGQLYIPAPRNIFQARLSANQQTDRCSSALACLLARTKRLFSFIFLPAFVPPGRVLLIIAAKPIY